MEWSLRMLIIAVLLFIMALLMVYLIMGWYGGAGETSGSFFDWTKGIIGAGESTMPR